MFSTTFSLPPIARVSAIASLNATPTAARSLSGEVSSTRRGFSTACAGGSGPPGKWWSVMITSTPAPCSSVTAAIALVPQSHVSTTLAPASRAARTPAASRS